MTTALNLRRIGCSDYATLIGVNKYASRHDLFRRLKTGEERALSPEVERAGRRGHRLQRATFEALCERIGWDPSAAVEDVSCEPEGRIWQRYTPDFVELTPCGVAEIKTITPRRFHAEGWGPDGSDVIPFRVRVQVQGQLEAMRADADHWRDHYSVDPLAIDRAHVGVMTTDASGFVDLAYTVDFDEHLAAMLVEEAERFWRDHIEANLAPDPDSSSACAEYLLATHPRVVVDLRPATVKEETLAEQLRDVRLRKKQLEEAEQGLENAIKAAIGDAKGIQGDGWKVTWGDVAGSTAWKKVAAELARKFEAQAELERMAEECKSKGTRRFEARFE